MPLLARNFWSDQARDADRNRRLETTLHNRRLRDARRREWRERPVRTGLRSLFGR